MDVVKMIFLLNINETKVLRSVAGQARRIV